MSSFPVKYLLHICMLFALSLLLNGVTAAQERSANDLEDLYWQRIQESKMNFTQADVDFMTGMIGHHAQALVMSDLAPKNEASPTIQTLAARIINAQKDEIATMQTWLKERNQPVPIVNIEGLNLTITMEAPQSDDMNHEDHGTRHEEDGYTDGEMDHSKMGHNEMDHDAMGMHDNHDMPGMLTQAQLEELEAARGAEFDRKFLAFMIQHHEGAVIMVTDLFDSDGAALDEQAFRLASDIQVDQITEIERMKLMLSQMSEAP